MKEIRLYGQLARRFGRRFFFDVANPAEAVRALCANLAGFKAYLVDHSEPGFHVLVGKQSSAALKPDELAYPISCQEVIRIVPAIAGAKNGLGSVILGVALVAISYFMPVGGFLINTLAGTVGKMLIMNGISQMLTHAVQPQSTEKPTNQPSYAFNGAVNTVTQGNPVPICYGDMVVGSQVISSGLSVEQIAP